jgi:hypothetical protein
MATLTLSAAPVTGGARSSRKGSLRRAQIAAVDQRIRQAEAAGISLLELLAQRRNLILRLAAAALEEDAPLPGADAEYERARLARAALGGTLNE